ncbi:hypothetical protein CPLU01_07814 [Colletotrichum plurivorum]|uniref:Ecp2 effector protein domain-containing protein n=1 Tax=Colletotrichum plurivorum TaxID=2175906 RepID=A0A8H6NE74_9PEZI|nr:hypothetical protein CPLU01_07814 [Colletotrichum plurivorum]
MQFTSALAVILSVVASVNAGLIDYPPEPDPYYHNNAPPRADQTEGTICGVDNISITNNLPQASRSFKDSAYHYLNNLPGNAKMSPGPGKCERVSCAYNLGIYFCNDNKHDIEVPWTDIAKYANDVAMVCGGGLHRSKNGVDLDPYGSDYFDFRSAKRRTNGQKFSKDGWNVYLNGDIC